METQLQLCLDEIRKEAAPKTVEKYTGKLKFQLNFIDGGITNINIGSDKSIVIPKLKLNK